MDLDSFREEYHRDISFGTDYLIDYMDSIGIKTVPKWLTADYDKLPRYNRDLDSEISSNNFVKFDADKIHLVYIKCDDLTKDLFSKDLFSEDGQKTLWIIENLEGEWASPERDYWYFLTELDAVHFKLVWG